MTIYQRRYATATLTAHGNHPHLQLQKAGGGFVTDKDWTPAPGDVTVVIDRQTRANISTLPTYDAGTLPTDDADGRWVFELSAPELCGRLIEVAVKRLPAFAIETYGDRNAMHEHIG